MNISAPFKHTNSPVFTIHYFAFILVISQGRGRGCCSTVQGEEDHDGVVRQGRHGCPEADRRGDGHHGQAAPPGGEHDQRQHQQGKGYKGYKLARERWAGLRYLSLSSR